MTTQTSFYKHPDLPYSISTGIPEHGHAEIEGYLKSLRVQGFCVIDRVIPENEVAMARENVLSGRQLLQKDRELERRKRIDLEHQANSGDDQNDNPNRLDNWHSNPARPPLPPHAEICDISRCEVFAGYLAAPRMIEVARAMLGQHIRIMQTEVNKSSRPARKPISEDQLKRRGWHSDWPHDLTAYGPNTEQPWKHCGAVAQPFPDVCMALSTVWYLGPEDVTPFNGGTWVVPGSHKDPRNPRGPDDGIDQWSPIPGEFQISAPAGSVYIQDSRVWHSTTLNQSDYERTGVVCRYAPWWLSGNEFANLHSGGHTLRTYVPQDVYQKFSPELQLLYRHLAEGEMDTLQPGSQSDAVRAQSLRHSEETAGNSHLVVGGMSIEEWESRRSQRKI